jgi:riboflavin synthase
MFTGIIEKEGRIEEIRKSGSGLTFLVESGMAHELKVDQSLAHNGICLTVEAIHGNTYQVTAVHETLAKTNASSWKAGDMVNLERAVSLQGRLDGHLVQGHVDSTGVCTSIEDKDGSWLFTFSFPDSFAQLVIEKGSIAVNGISLTAWNVKNNAFSVAVIPYTMEHTNLRHLKTGDEVNIEFDMIGKYILRFHQLKQTHE